MGEPLDRVAMDLAELPVTKHGNRYLLVVQDYFSKYVELYALPTKESKHIVEILHNEYFTRYGVPLKLYSDKGREFDNALMEELCDLLKITPQTSCGYNPPVNGMVERTNCTVKNLLRNLIITTNCPATIGKLAEIRCAYNNTVHSTTGFTLHQLKFSQSWEARLPTELFYESIERPRVGNDLHATMTGCWSGMKLVLMRVTMLNYEQLRPCKPGLDCSLNRYGSIA